MASKRNNGRELDLWGGWGCCMRMESSEWSEEDVRMWWTMDPGKSSFHALFARALSRRICILPSIGWLRNHMKGELKYPRLMKFHTWIVFRKWSICRAGLKHPLTFSNWLVISLKSPTQSHGRWLDRPRDCRSAQVSSRLLVSGCP